MEIGIWGDSITYGGPEEGWVGLLRKALGDDVEVYNRGICGDASTDILKRFAIEADAIEPQTIIIAVGANDSKIPVGSKTNKTAIEKYETNVRELIAQARARAKRIVIIGITNSDEKVLADLIKADKRNSMFWNKELARYNESVKKIAKEEKLEFIDMQGVIEPADLTDGIHPNMKGYKKMFDRIYPIISASDK